MIKLPKLFRSLSALACYKIGAHIGQEINRQRLEVRSWSRDCLKQIQENGDEYDQTVLVNYGYGKVMSISFSTAGGIGEEEDYEIQQRLNYIQWFLGDLHEGSNRQQSFQPLPLLARNTEEQIEEEGANEEIEAQMNNIEIEWNIKGYANDVKSMALNLFIPNN
ncbi:MAG: hypothetical protein EZS28_031326 [Streblomastix strix]|uniref:Uncharacterized protein n=1 Tax=Streblomastix strix TaxID=222440 RepID=A0A5J4URX2_9EUKA|nr:MAG: hypothetical protein EZS28_031326 [Streblomastix strix]